MRHFYPQTHKGPVPDIVSRINIVLISFLHEENMFEAKNKCFHSFFLYAYLHITAHFWQAVLRLMILLERIQPIICVLDLPQ